MATDDQQLKYVLDLLPDPAFAIDNQKRVIAWNRACEELTGIKRDQIIGRGDYAYAQAFRGERRPVLIDLLDQEDPKIEATYKNFQRKQQEVSAETFIPQLNAGRGVYFWAKATPLYDAAGRRCGTVEVVHDITELRRSEQALRESELKYRTLFETAGDAIMLLSGDRFLDCNHHTLKLFGCTRDQIIGAPPYYFSPPTQPDGRDSREKALEKMNLALTQGPQTFEWEHCRLDRTPFMAEVSLNKLDLGGEILLQAIVRDITERKLFQEQLLESERKYRELVELSNSIILRWDLDGTITFINEFGRQFFGYANEEIIGRHVLDTIVPATESGGRDLRKLMESMCADPKAFEHNINENMRRNGERVWIAWANRLVPKEGAKGMEILSVGTDITPLKNAEEQIRKLNQDLQRHTYELERRVAERTAELALAKERAEAADRLKSIFLATMSHELRTPLNSIIGFTGIILQELAGPLNQEQRKQLEMVQGSAKHLLALINDILDISKIEAGQVEIICKPFDLYASLKKVVGLVRPLAEKKGLTVCMKTAPDLGSWTTDQRRFEQIVLNLLNNAVKFTDRGRVTLDAAVEPCGLRLSVIDTGIGIKSEDLPKLFQPFYKIDSQSTRNREGTGLGLAISRKLAELLEGEISVESEWGKGSTFTLRLPFKGKTGHEENTFDRR